MYSPQFMRFLLSSETEETKKQESETKIETKDGMMFRFAKLAIAPVQIRK